MISQPLADAQLFGDLLEVSIGFLVAYLRQQEAKIGTGVILVPFNHFKRRCQQGNANSVLVLDTVGLQLGFSVFSGYNIFLFERESIAKRQPRIVV